jgi:hypothetical protein
MKIIAHRGLLSGPDKDKENRPEQILYALSLGFDVEVDLWRIGNKLYLGHDNPQYEIQESFLDTKRFWIHAKNFAALEWLNTTEEAYNYFWHDVDGYTLTSRNFIWTTNKAIHSENTVIVIPNYPQNSKSYKCYAICCDYGIFSIDTTPTI